jgi:hypothetical protein
MTSNENDDRLEASLRDVLARRAPGPAPIRLRERVDRVPAHQPAAPRRLANAVSAVAGIAAVIAFLVVLLQIRTSMPSVGVAPSATPAPVPFDPTISGPGINTGGSPVGPVITVLGLVACAFVAALVRGRRQLLPAAAAALFVAYAATAALVPATLSVSGWSPGLSVAEAPRLPGFREDVFYVVADARQPYSFGLLLFTEGPLPIRVEGVREPNTQPSFLGSTWTAVWLDGEPNGGTTGPAHPFEPLTWPHQGRGLWLVGSAGACAVGPSFDPQGASAAAVGTSSRDIEVNISVLGWPRTIGLESDLSIVEPDRSCSG